MEKNFKFRIFCASEIKDSLDGMLKDWSLFIAWRGTEQKRVG
jgi:hypothetical protein